MGGNSNRYAPVAGGRPAPGAADPNAGGRWELPKAPPGSPQGIARNWVTPSAPAAGGMNRDALAALAFEMSNYPNGQPSMNVTGFTPGGPAQQPGLPAGYTFSHAANSR